MAGRARDAVARFAADHFLSMAAASFFGLLLVRQRVPSTDTGASMWSLAAQLAAVVLSRRRPHLALVLSVAVELVVCAVGHGPDIGIGGVIVCAAAMTARKPRDRRGLAVGAAAIALVAYLPAILRWDSNAVYPGSAKAAGGGLVFFVLFVAYMVRSDFASQLLEIRTMRERAEVAEAGREEARRDERARIARELHDVVAHQMSVVVSQAQGARAVMASDPAKARRALDTISSTTRDALVELRRLVGITNPGTPASVTAPDQPQPALTYEDFARLASNAEAAGLQNVRFYFEDHGHREGPVPTGIQLSGFRTIQEAITNAAKHAPGSDLEVRVDDFVTLITVTVTNGPARQKPTDMPGSGVGLIGMRERVSVFGGTLETGPTSDGGWSVVARFPTMEPSTTSE